MLSTETTLPCRHSNIVALSVKRIARTVMALLACTGAVLYPGTSHAGGIASSCEELILFEGANVNNYVKQFGGVTDQTVSVDKAGKMLALLVQLDGLYFQIGYGPLGYVYIPIKRKEGPYLGRCSNAEILERITGKRCCSNGRLQPGRAALILSGNFQRVEDQFYLLTNIEFIRNGIEEIVSIPSLLQGNTIDHFSAQLPATSVSFDPRKFTRQQLDKAATAYSDVMYVRSRPDSKEQAQKFEPFDIDGFSYYIEEVRPDWMKIRSYNRPGAPNRPSGWVNVPHEIGGLGLRELLPELYFMDATALYLQTRIARKSLSSNRYNSYLTKYEGLMSEFAKRIKGDGDRRALGLLKSMHAFLLLEKPEHKTTEIEMKNISSIFSEAADLLPTSSDARSLAALTRFAGIMWTDNASFTLNASKLESDLLQALSTDPENVYIKANLEQLWRLRSELDKSIWQTDKLNALRGRFRQDQRIQQIVNKKSGL